MKKFGIFGVLFFFTQCISAQSTLQIGTTTVQVDTVITGLDIPWEVQWGTDSHLWITERKGLVSRIHPVTGVKTVVLDIVSSVHQQSESGLLGLIQHPEFETTPEVFLVYTYWQSGSVRERLVKYTYNGTSLVSPVVLLENIPGNSTHIGSRLLFLPDGTLLMTTGDAQNLALPQDLNSMAGKILRMHTDGSVPDDNPFDNSLVYALGLRNTQGLTLHPNGTLWMSEHGPATDDEFQQLFPGGNYGWPNVEGFCTTPSEIQFCADNDVIEPVLVWTPTIAPSDLVYYQNENFPEWNNSFLMTVLKDKRLVAIRMNEELEGVESENHYLVNQFGRLRDICVGPEKEIYLATNGQSWSNTQPNTHSIIRLKVVADNLGLTEYLNLIRIYPNPFKDKLTISLSSTSVEILTVKLIGTDGKIVYTYETVSEQLELPTHQLSPGIYILEILGSNGLYQLSKLVKE
jgi:aldose sugar dehydrogenase